MLPSDDHKIKERIKQHALLNKLADWLRPPSPKNKFVGRKNREEFSDYVTNSGLGGAVLDIGGGPIMNGNSDGLSYEIMERKITFDYKILPGVDLVADAKNLPFKDGSLSAVLFQGVIEHIEDPKAAITEIVRVLESGGVVYVEAPFMQHLHYDPIDYYRFTVDGLEHVFKDFKTIDSGVLHGPAAVLVDVLTEFIAVLFKSPVFYWGVKWSLGWLLFIVRYLDVFLIGCKRAKFLCLGVYYLGSKRA